MPSLIAIADSFTRRLWPTTKTISPPLLLTSIVRQVDPLEVVLRARATSIGSGLAVGQQQVLRVLVRRGEREGGDGLCVASGLSSSVIATPKMIVLHGYLRSSVGDAEHAREHLVLLELPRSTPPARC